MIKQTTWHPDTCDCVLSYEWDTEVPEDEREHTITNITYCPAHTELPMEDCFALVQAENSFKNVAITQIALQIPSLSIDSLSWSFDEYRDFQIDTSNMDPQTANDVEAIVIALKGK